MESVMHCKTVKKPRFPVRSSVGSLKTATVICKGQKYTRALCFSAVCKLALVVQVYDSLST